jgi:hypothetical protein
MYVTLLARLAQQQWLIYGKSQVPISAGTGNRPATEGLARPGERPGWSEEG